MAQALYRKYRPQKLEELLGHDTNVAILKNAAKENRLGQAYLFYGPRGTGKTTTARLLAKLLNCELRRENEKFRALGEPCNECRACMEINAGNAFDVIEIDAASNRGIDEIRNLKESARTAPSAGPHKIYIIDEAHMLTGPAFNALLKTLEEPPIHAVFVLATTEYEKVPPTITSRAQRFLFKRLPKTEILKKLLRVAKTEKIAVAEDVLELIAASAEGSMRDAESLLDQLSAHGGNIDLATAERLLGRVGFRKVEELASLLVDGKVREAIAYLNEIYEEGYNLSQLTKELVHYIRKALSLSLNPALERAFSAELTKDELARLIELSRHVRAETHIPFIKALIRAYSEMRYSPFAMVPIELAIIETLGNIGEKGGSKR